MAHNQKNEQQGRTLLETITVLVVAAILLLAGILGYSTVIHYWRKNQTVSQISELAVRYKLRPIAKNGAIDIKDIYPEAERATAAAMKTADTDAGRVSLMVSDSTSFSIIVSSILSDSCEAVLKNGEYEAVLYKDGLKEYEKSEEYLAVGKDLLKNWDDLSDEEKPEKLRGKTKKEIIAYLCHSDKGKIRTMSLVYGQKCPKPGFSYWYGGKCWSCPSSETEDRYGHCCEHPELRECGVCSCGKMHCDKDGSGQCVECVKDTDCEGNKVCSPEKKCIPCRPYTQDGCTDGKWCSSWYKCEECLEDYDAAETDKGYRCGEAKALCDKTTLEKWHCEEWPCAQNLFSTTCRDGVSGTIGLGGKCSNDVCRCAEGLRCQAPDADAGETCSTCQCVDEAPAGLTAPAQGRQQGQSCTADGSCPCGTNAFGVQLICADNVCSCIAEGQTCGASTDCCSGYCNSLGQCGPEPGTCQKIENGTECSADATDLENCCVAGTTCQSIRGEHVCCPDNGQGGASCTADTCCDTGFICDSLTHKCIPETVCSDGGSCDTLSCCTGQNCITRSDSGAKTCCPEGETGGIGDPCTNSNCCESGLCEGGVCVAACAGTWVGKGETKTCCENTGENGTTCVSDACCTSGKCVKVNATDETGVCCGTDDSDGADCSDNLCCASGKCTNNKCCPITPPGDGETCSEACGCAEGFNCNPVTLTCVPPTCVNSEEDRQKEGATCSEYCPCGVNSSGEQMTCGTDGKCHTCTSGTWRQAEGKSGACCPVAEGLDLGSVCTSDSCCKSGNCSIAEGESEGHCCESTYTWIKDLKDNSNGQCCANVTSFGEVCSGENDSCCKAGNCRQVYTKMEASTYNNTYYPCVKWRDWKEKCTICHCGSCSKSTCYYSECKEYDTSKPQIETKMTRYANKGLAGPYKCCEGNGDLGSPCSEECPCNGTAFQYYVDGKLQKTEITMKEYNSAECSCQRVPLLYCRPEGNGRGTCQLNPYVLASATKSYKANEVNCAYTHHFSNVNNGKCYLCPAQSSFRENDAYVACCPLNALTITDACYKYSKKDGYESGHVEGELYEGFYLDERTGQMTLCSKGSFCVGGNRYPCEEGTYSDQQGATSCSYCGKGYYCPEGATKKSPCPAGFYCPEWGTTKQDMENEYYCPEGTYSTGGASDDITDCKVCNVNNYCPGKTNQIACDGKHLPGSCPEKGMEVPIEGVPGQYLANSKTLKPCQRGYYCPDGLNRYSCKAGTYQDEEGKTSCKLAPAGVAISVSGSVGESDSTAGAWERCSTGRYASGEGNIECLDCPSGTYQNERGQAECKPCPEGTTSSIRSGAISACKACNGEVAQVSAVQTQCCGATSKVVANEATGWQTCCSNNHDRYCKNNNGVYSCRKNDSCALPKEEAITDCSANQYISSGKCTECSPGYFCNGMVKEKCPVGTYSEKGDGVCKKCAPGTYQDQIGQTSCKSVSTGQYVDTEGATTYKICTEDTVPNATHTGCEACPVGTVVKNGACQRVCNVKEMYINGSCRKCRQNFYCPNGYEEIPCPDGEYSMPYASVCTKCDTGKYWDSNSGQCKTCEAGNYCDKGIKYPCPSGTTSGPRATACSKCDPGSYFVKSTNSCQPCAAGSYSLGGTVTACTKCEAGEYQPSKGQSSCLKCPQGTYRASVGGTSCTSCGEGKWYEGTGATAASQCTTCPEGYYCVNGTKTICPKGYKCLAGTSKAVACSAGTYQDEEGKSTCKTCTATGSYSKAGSAECSTCEAGKYTTNHQGCSLCSNGTIYATKNADGSFDGKQVCCSSTVPKYCKGKNSANYGCRQEKDCATD